MLSKSVSALNNYRFHSFDSYKCTAFASGFWLLSGDILSIVVFFITA